MSRVTEQLLSADGARALLGSVLPEVRVSEIVSRTCGQLSAVYEVRRADGADALIVKVYADRWRWKLAKEVDVYPLLARHGVGPIPRIVRAEPDPGPSGFAFVVMTKLSGEPLSHVSDALDAARTRLLYRQIGATLAAMHRIGQHAYGYRVARILEPQPNNTAYMTRQFAKKLREFRDLGGDLALHDLIAAHVAERTGLFAHFPGPVLCHNDFHEGNVLVARDDGDDSDGAWRVTGFIDVENVLAADPLLDLAKTDYYSIKGDAAKLAGLVDGYGPLPEDWRGRLSLYRLYHALELWDWFALLGNVAPLASIARDMESLADAGR